MQTTASTTLFFFGRRTGAPFFAGQMAGDEVLVTPESLVLLVQQRNWGYVWNWPIAVSVRRGDRTERKAVVDVTRLALWSLGLAAVAMALGFLFAPRTQ